MFILDKEEFLFGKYLKVDLDLRISMDSYVLSNDGAFPLITEVTPHDIYHLWLTPTLYHIMRMHGVLLTK